MSYNPIKKAKAAARDRFYKEGGKTRCNSIFRDKKKQASKDACRGKLRDV